MSGSSVAVRRAPWYARGLHFECLRCGRCCRGEPGYVWVTLADLNRIAAYLQTDRDGLMASSVRHVRRRLSLRERPNGDCVFYADGCTIYPVRPRQCRTFPFWPENLTSRRGWDRLANECPGIGRGRLWTCGEIDLLAGRARPRRGRTDVRLDRVLRNLMALYRRVDTALARWAGTCSACGRCCDFTTHENVLYVTELERVLIERRCGPGDAAAPPGRCPYQAGTLCAVREVRPLGCRTFFCDSEAAAHGQEWHEEALRRMAPLREETGLTTAYAPLLAADRRREKSTAFCLDTSSPSGLNP